MLSTGAIDVESPGFAGRSSQPRPGAKGVVSPRAPSAVGRAVSSAGVPARDEWVAGSVVVLKLRVGRRATGEVPLAASPSAAAVAVDDESCPRVSVVLPCLDEAGSVGRCVTEARAVLTAAGIHGEVIVVDNGSTDGSAAVAAGAGARVVTERRPGYGRALRAGFAAARAGVVVMADADSTYDLARIPALAEPVLAGRADLVLGNRLGPGARAAMPALHRLVGTPTLSFLIGRVCGGPVVADSQSGFRAFDRRRVDALGLRAAGMELASEMLIRAARAGLRIEEVDVGYRPRIGESKLSTFSDGLRHLRLIVRLAAAPTLGRSRTRPGVAPVSDERVA
jgi:hypothetical protein